MSAWTKTSSWLRWWLSYARCGLHFKHRLTKIALPKVYTENTAKLAACVGESDMTETKCGTVTHYYNHLHVAGVTITDGELHKGDTIHIKGHTSDFEQKVESMEIDHEAVDVAKPGDQIGLTVIEHAREHDTVFKVT